MTMRCVESFNRKLPADQPAEAGQCNKDDWYTQNLEAIDEADGYNGTWFHTI